MSASDLIFETGDLTVTVGDTGMPRRVEHRARPGLGYLGPQLPGAVRIAGRSQDWDPVGMITDVDETEVRYAVTGLPEVEYTVRNSFTGGWVQRHLLQNTSSTPIRIDELTLPLLPGEACVGWALAAGTDSCWALRPADGTGPVLTGTLTRGVVLADHDQPGFRTGEMLLQPGRRFVLQWRIESNDSVEEVARRRGAVVTPRTELPVGEPFPVDDPDVAVVPPDPVSVESEDRSQLISCDRPGRFDVELRSARGTSVVELCWLPPVERVIADLTREWLSGERSGAGIGVLRGSGAALAVQQAVIDRLTDDSEAAEDALELHTARLLDRTGLDSMDIAFLAQESVRTGDHDPAWKARAEFLQATEFRPGMGLAALRLLVAELTNGGGGEGILSRLRELRPAAMPSTAGDDHLLAAGCRLELFAATGPAAAEQGADPDELVAAVGAVGAELGFGLPGHRLGRLRPSIAVYAAAVVDLLPERTGGRLAGDWEAGQPLLGERTRLAALASLLWPQSSQAEEDLGAALGWMVLGRPVR